MGLAQDVLCAVSSCFFWENGNKCGADSIYVVSQLGNEASHSSETDCKTFVPKS